MAPADIIAWHEEKLAGIRHMLAEQQAIVRETPPGRERETAHMKVAALGVMMACHDEALEFLRTQPVPDVALIPPLSLGGMPA